MNAEYLQVVLGGCDGDCILAPHLAQDFRDWPILPIKVQPTYKLLGYTQQKPVPLPSHLPLEKNRVLRVGGEDECVSTSSFNSLPHLPLIHFPIFL